MSSFIQQAPEAIGVLEHDFAFAPGPQERPDSCAIRAQQHVLSIFGVERTESELVQDAINHGEYCGYGTSVDDVGNLLERNGVAVKRYEAASIAHIIAELGAGHKVIIGYDAFEVGAESMYDKLNESLKDLIAKTPNHAVVVSNVDPNTFDVDIIDPADGEMHRISAERFLNAWDDSNNFMIATVESPKEFAYTRTGGIEMYDEGIEKISGLTGEGTVPGLGALGHVSGVAGDAVPGLGGQGHLSGITGDVASNLGGLGHVSGYEPNFGDGAVVETVGLDMNHDGIIDSLAIDVDGDGITDFIGVDIDGDGTIDRLYDASVVIC